MKMRNLFIMMISMMISMTSFGQTIQGNTDVCILDNETYSVAVTGTNPVTWEIQVPNGTTYDSSTSGVNHETLHMKWYQGSVANVTNIRAYFNGGNPLISVHVHDLSHPTINGDSTTCASLTKTYTTQTGKYNYTWNHSGGTITDGGGNTDNYITIKWNYNGYVSVNYSNAFMPGNFIGCPATSPTIKNVTVITNPIISIVGDDSVCGGIHTYSVNIQNPSGSYTYNWEAMNGTFWSAVNGATIDIGWDNPGLGMAKVTVTDSFTCVSNTQLPVIIFPSVTPSLTGNTNPCVGTINTYITDANQSNYNWSVNGGTILSGQSTDTITLVWNLPGYHSMSVSYITSTGCSATKTFDVNIFNQPPSTITGNSETVFMTEYTYTTEPNMSNYTWTVTGGDIMSTSNTNTISVNWSIIGTGTVSIYYDVPNGCRSMTSIKNVDISPSICMVTYDTSENKNRIYMNSVPDTFDHYNIYKLNAQSIYEKIGELPTTSTSYVDTTSEPLVTSNSYKISVVDGFESVKSPLHTTIYLSYTIQGSVIYLHWTPYIGFDFDSYHIYKKINNGSWVEIGSEPNSVFDATDTYSGGTVIYYIQVLPLCTPTAKIHSNFQKVQDDGIFENKINTLKVCPNPARTTVNIDLHNGINYIDILDINGRTMYSYQTSDNKYSVNVESLPVGLYLIKVKNDKEIYLGKFQKVN